MKVLLSAYACEPNKGSEPGVGWNWAKQIARFHNVWVLTRANNREVIEDELKKNPNPNMHFYYLDLPRWIRFWKRGQRGLYLYYFLWQIAAYFAAKKLHKEIHFDLANHITFVNDWIPSLMCLLPIPFVWGPIGSNQKRPAEFMRQFEIRIRILEFIKNIVRAVFRKYNPFVFITMKRSKIIIVINNYVKSNIRKKFQHKVTLLPAIGINFNEIPESNIILPSTKIKVLSAGRLIYWKGFRLSIRAFAEFSERKNNAILYILGDGPERKYLGRLIFINSLYDRVIFTGNLPRKEALKYFSSCDIFLYPCLEEAGLVVLEAMAAGMPVVCLDYGGPGEMVTEECGIKVKPDNTEQVVHDLAYALNLLASNKELRKHLGEGARRRAEEVYNWDRKGEKISKIYSEIIKNKIC